MKVRTLERTEWTTAVLLTLVVLVLVSTRAWYAGALWRDECAAVQLARMPSFADISKNFQHEAFPLLFPATLRAYTNIFGTSDTALRWFGLAIGIMLVSVAWLNQRATRSGIPLFFLALFGLNMTFLTWGTSVRGYGIGSVLIVLAFGLISRLLVERTQARIVSTFLVTLLSVQYLLQNTVLLLAIVLSAGTVCLSRRNFKLALIILGIGALCAISLLPYIGSYSSGTDWNIVLKYPLTLRRLWHQLGFAFGKPLPLMTLIWPTLLSVLVGGAATRLYLIRHRKPAPEWDLLLFGILVSITSIAGYYAFLKTVSYPTEPWYYLALLAIIAAALDLLASRLAQIRWIRLARLAFVAGALAVLPFANWSDITSRQTNIDIVVHKLEQSATSNDLIVVIPWYVGIGFNWYYHGVTPWVTAPIVDDHRIHRYDLLKAKMMSSNPVDDLLERISRTLASGNHVWFVGRIEFLREGQVALSLAPAPDPEFGWHNDVYMKSWAQQVGGFIQTHASRGEWVVLPAYGSVNHFENVRLLVAQGWRQ